MGEPLGDVQAAAGEAAERSRTMTKRAAGAWVLSARFLAWARSNHRGPMIEEIERAREEYKRSDAHTARYEALSDEELDKRRKKAGGAYARLTAEVVRRGDQSDGGD